jgi:hypothetical protein
MNILTSSLIGIPIGILCSLLAWWLLFHIITPKVEFSEKISKILLNGTHKYRIKFGNVGRRRIIDVSLHGRVITTGLSSEFPDKITDVPIKLKRDYWPVLSKKEMKMSSVESDHLVFNDIIFPSEVRLMALENTLKLEDVFSIGLQPILQISVFAYDEFSGSRKVFCSKKYNVGDIVEKPFASDTLSLVDY